MNETRAKLKEFVDVMQSNKSKSQEMLNTVPKTDPLYGILLNNDFILDMGKFIGDMLLDMVNEIERNSKVRHIDKLVVMPTSQGEEKVEDEDEIFNRFRSGLSYDRY